MKPNNTIGSCILLAGALFLLNVLVPQSGFAQTKWPQVNQYAESLAVVDQREGKTDLEPLFRNGMSAVESVLKDVESYAHENWDKPDYDPQRHFASDMKVLKGFFVSQYEGDAVIVGPDFKFWLDLAQRKGQPVDVDFFTMAQKQFPENPPFPAFVQMTWDYGGCTRYGEGILTELYSGWAKYQAMYPAVKYDEWVFPYMEDIRRTFEPPEGQDICSCGGKASFIKEAREFIQKHPGDILILKLEKLLKDAQASPAKVKFECHYG